MLLPCASVNNNTAFGTSQNLTRPGCELYHTAVWLQPDKHLHLLSSAGHGPSI
jgi:hypothetical protein